MRVALKNLVSIATPIALVSACLLLIASCGITGMEEKKIPMDAKQALVNTGDITAYSLEPTQKSPNNAMLHGYTVLGSIPLSGQDAKMFTQEYIDSLQEYLDEAKNGHESASGCLFQPHHALRIETADHHTYDYLACFTCGLIEVYKDDVLYWNGQVRGTAVKLNEMLQALHVPVSKTK